MNILGVTPAESQEHNDRDVPDAGFHVNVLPSQQAEAILYLTVKAFRPLARLNRAPFLARDYPYQHKNGPQGPRPK